MTAIIASLITLVIGLLGGAYLRGRVRNDEPLTPDTIDLPDPPKKTAHEHTNDTTNDTINAVVEAANAHGVDASTVADDLEWLLGDDV